MKFKDTSKAGNGETVYNAAFGKSELFILSDVLGYLQRTVPTSFFTMGFKSRINAMSTEINKVINDNNLRKTIKRPKGWNLSNIDETY